MPVIRGESRFVPLQAKVRRQLVRELAEELGGAHISGGPIIFEIPLGQTRMKDVIVVWDKLKDAAVEERTSIILDAYRHADKVGEKVEKTVVSLAVGLTQEEAWGPSYLPYIVDPSKQADSQIRDALLNEGAITLPNGKVQLHLPTLEMAEAARSRLLEKLPGAGWGILQWTPDRFKGST